MQAKIIETNSHYFSLKAAAEEIGRGSLSCEEEYLVFCEDKLTAALEREILKNTESGCAFNVEVTDFSRFAAKRFPSPKNLSKGGAVIVIGNILRGEKNLKVLSASGRKKNMAGLLYEQISQFASAKVGFEELERFSEIGGLVGAKAEDVAAVYKEYCAFKGQGYTDEADLLTALPEKIKGEDFKNFHIYFVGYTSFTRQMASLIKALAAACKECVGVFAVGEGGGYDSAARDYFEKILKELSNERDGGYQVKKAHYPLLAESALLSQYLYSPRLYSANRNCVTDRVTLYCASDVTDEARFVAKTITAGIMEGLRYSDFAVVLAEEKCISAFKRIMADYSIPCFFDTERKLTSSPLFKLVRAQAEVSLRNYGAEEVVEFVKNPLFEPDFLKSDAFEDFVAKYGIRRKGFFRPFEGERAEEVRKEFIDKYKPLPLTGTAGEYAKAVGEQLEILGAKDKLSALLEGLKADKKQENADFLSQDYDAMFELLDRIREFAADDKLKLQEFIDILSCAADSSVIRIIPSYSDAVYIGSPEKSKALMPKRLFVAGLDSEKPLQSPDCALFTDSDIACMAEAGVKIEPTIRVVNERKIRELVSAASSFSERVYYSYSVLSCDGKRQKRSEIFSYITKLFKGSNGKPLSFITLSKANAGALGEGFMYADYMFGEGGLKKFALEAGDFSFGSAVDPSALSAHYKIASLMGYGEQLQDILRAVNGDTEKRVDGSLLTRGRNISASSLEEYFECPYRYFLKRGLKIDEKQVYKVENRDAGNFLHRAIEKFTESALMGEGGADLLNEAVRAAEETAAEKEYEYMFKDPANIALLSRLKKECVKNCLIISDQIKNSNFKVLGSEISFGNLGRYPAVKIDSEAGEFYLSGKVDRADESDEYIRVIDYKSGSVDESEKALFCGRKLQLYLYADAVGKARGKKAAGVYYYPVSDDFSTENKNLLKGRTVSEESAVFSQDTTLCQDKTSSDQLDFKVSFKEGRAVFPSISAFISDEDMQNYILYAKKVSAKALKEISQGQIEISPYSGACDYCPMSAVCKREENLIERKAGTVKSSTVREAAKEETEKEK